MTSIRKTCCTHESGAHWARDLQLGAAKPYTASAGAAYAPQGMQFGTPAYVRNGASESIKNSARDAQQNTWDFIGMCPRAMIEALESSVRCRGTWFHGTPLCTDKCCLIHREIRDALPGNRMVMRFVLIFGTGL